MKIKLTEAAAMAVPMHAMEVGRLYIVVDTTNDAGHVVIKYSEDITVDLTEPALDSVWAGKCMLLVSPLPAGSTIELTQE